MLGWFSERKRDSTSEKSFWRRTRLYSMPYILLVSWIASPTIMSLDSFSNLDNRIIPIARVGVLCFQAVLVDSRKATLTQVRAVRKKKHSLGRLPGPSVRRPDLISSLGLCSKCFEKSLKRTRIDAKRGQSKVNYRGSYRHLLGNAVLVLVTIHCTLPVNKYGLGNSP